MPGCFSRLSNKFSSKKGEKAGPGPNVDVKPNVESEDSSAGKEPSTGPEVPGEESSKQQTSAVKDRWREAFEQLSEDKQEILKNMGFDNLKSGSMESSIKDLVDTVDKKQEECQDKFWKFKFGGKEIVFREYTNQIVGCLEKAGNIAIQFAPPQASLPWDLIKNLMKIPVNESEQMSALLLTTEAVVSITTRSQVYEEIYLTQDGNVPLSAIQKQLEESLIGLYKSSLVLLARSWKLLSSHTSSRILEAIVNPGKANDNLEALGKQEGYLLKIVQTCETSRSATSDKRANEMLEALQAPMARVDAGVSHLLSRVDEGERIKLLEWISKVPFGMNHDDIREKRTPGTGEWLVEHEDFNSWKDKESSVLFWLQGNPGSGKTYLTSKVVDTIRDRISYPLKNEGFAFFYCKRDDEPRDKPLAILQSFVRQLSTTARNPESMQTKLQETCREARVKGTDFRFEQCKKQILTSLDIYQKTTLVIDAMDECDPQLRHELVGALKFFLKESKKPVKIFISSRPDRALENQLENSPNVGIQASDNQEDIKKYIDSELNRLANANTLLGSMKSEIMAALLERSQGMFQYVFLMLQWVGTGNSRGDVRRHLNALPPSLDTAYDLVWREIEAQEEPAQTLTKRALRWTMAAGKPMTSSEILAAIRLDLNGGMLPLDDLVNEQGLLSLCKNFLSIDSQLKVWRFPHLSVREYLEKKDNWSVSHAHYHAASACLSYFVKKYENDDSELDAQLEANLEIESEKPGDTDGLEKPAQSDDGFHTFHPLHIYVRHTWVHHVNGAKDVEMAKLGSLLKTFLGSPNESSVQYRRWHQKTSTDFDSGGLHQHYLADKARIIFKVVSPGDAAVFAMCRFSLATIVWDWWENAEIDMSLVNGYRQNLLEIAASGGCLPICERLVQILVDQGADVNAQREFFSNSLENASSKGHEKVVQMLLDRGADFNARGKTTDDALRSASKMGHEKVVQLLLDRGADVNTEAGDIGTVLNDALALGHKKVFQLLLNRGADVNAHHKLGTALQLASERGDEKVVQMLLDKDADVNAQGVMFGTALEAAIWPGRNEKVVQLLLDKGADVNVRGGDNALPVASFEGNEKVVQMLLDKDADVNIQGGRHGTALQAASFNGHEKVVQMLLDKDADVNIQGGRYRTALHAASFRGHEKVVQMLLDRGVDINARAGRYGTALQAASFKGHEKVVQMLLDKDADVNAQGGHYGTALQVASKQGKEKVVQMLIDKGVDVNIEDKAL